MVHLKSGLMFLVPPSTSSKRYFKDEDGASKVDQPYMVGVFVDQQAAQQHMAKFQGQP